jgi:hypothetical protein
MTAIIKNKFRIKNAKDFLENLDATKHSIDRNHYLFIGKPTVWGDGSQNDELYPVLPTDTLAEEAEVWDEMLGLKKIAETHGSLVIPRSDWDATGNTIYAIFDDKDSELHRQPSQARIESASITNNNAGNYYVLNSDYELFVCVENGNNSVSTVKPVKPPTITDLVDYSDQDGYVWKYVTTIQQSDIVKFLTDSWMPIKTITSNDGSDQWTIQQDATAGEILSVVVEDGGSGYVKVHDGLLSNPQNIGGKGTATLTALPSGDAPSTVVDHYAGCQIHIVDGDGVGQIYTIESYDGSAITLTQEWEEDGGGIIVTNASEYKILPALSITSNGTSQIKLRPILSAGVITRVLIVDGGEGATYVSAQVLDTAGGSGSVIRVVLSPTKGLLNDPEKDLGAFFVMLNSKLQYTEGAGDFPLSNDYRQIGIVRDVKEFSGVLATSETLIATKKLELTNIVEGANGLFRSDEVITDGSVSAIVLDFDETNETITFIQNSSTGYGNFSTSATLSGADSLCEATISSVVDEEVKKYEGDILYLENRRAILRSEDQVEDIKVIIEF